MFSILRRLRHRLRCFLVWLWKQEGTPGQRARGLAVGVFSGCFPLFGLQTFFGLLLASLFKGNHLLAVTATWVSNPFTYLPLYWFNYQVGSSLLDRISTLHGINAFGMLSIVDQGLFLGSRLLLGSALVGLLSGLLIGLTAYTLLNQRPFGN